MARYAYERLSAQDNSFLLMEAGAVYMHVAATAIYDATALATAEGGIDIEAFRRGTAEVLHLIPRYRQKLKWIPYAKHPVWIDDRHFELDYHIRHTALPRPGSDTQLKALGARIMAQPLDRTRPLWELWVVEGLAGNRFAVISKVHHCMIDGSSGVDLATIMMSLSPDHQPREILPYMPRPEPSSAELLLEQIRWRAQLPLEAIRRLRALGMSPSELWKETTARVDALADLLQYAFKQASLTPLNGHIGPHRRFDWLQMPLEQVKRVRRALECTVNDLVLATVAGAVRAYLQRRRVDPDTIDFRVSAPVSVRREEERGQMGNRVSSWILRLPIGEADPLTRLEEIHESTQRLKESQQALAVEMLMAAAEWAPAQLMSLGSRATSGPINMIVTNVPGPQVPLYMLGCRLLEMYPQVPLLENTGLGVALFSYDGKMFWGFNADPALVPDVGTFGKLVRGSFAELEGAAGCPAFEQAAAPPHAVEPEAGAEPVVTTVGPRSAAGK
jgi:diacylglycerol O-acyltransferase